MNGSPMMRTVNADWGTRAPTLHFTLQQDRLQAVGLTSSAVAQQLQFLLTGVPVTAVREDIRTVQVIARSGGDARLDPARLDDFTLTGANGQRIPLSQVGKVDVRMEEPIMRWRDRVPTLTVRGDIAEGLQPPDVSAAITQQLQPIVAPRCRAAIESRKPAPSRNPARPRRRCCRCSRSCWRSRS